MLRTVIPATSLEVSRLGFGTASLHHLPTTAQRLKLLSCALDTGFTHFDTARMYGEGMAERTLGLFVSAGNRSRVTIATKIGFPARFLPERIPQWMYVEKAAALVSRRIGFRQRTVRPRDLSESAAQKSFAASLRALRSDSVDILCVHEPSPTELPELTDLAAWLERQRQTGCARYLGLAGNADNCVAVARALPGLFDILQVEDSLTQCEADVVCRAGWPMQVTFGYLRMARAGDSVAGSAASPAAVTAAALMRNSAGMVLVSTRRLDRVTALAAAAAEAAGR